MTIELDYFPPKGTKYTWNPPVLKKRPWYSSINFKDHYRELYMHVSRLDDSSYIGRCIFRDISREVHNVTTACHLDALDALLATEELAEKLLAEQNLPAWAEEALAAGWSPP